jgi:alkaline phosphatase D
MIMLDTRWSRSPPPSGKGTAANDAAGQTVLGEEQWAWVAEQLRKPAELRLLCSSIQVVADGHRFERWGNFPRERQRLFELIRETAAGGVVFLSGDRHVAALYETTAGTPYRFVELTSSGINQVWRSPSDLQGNRLGELYAAANFGTVDIDWDAGAVRLTARAMNGRPARQIELGLDSLAIAR